MPVYAMTVAKRGPKLGEITPNDDPTATGTDRIDIRAGNNTLEIWPMNSLGAEAAPLRQDWTARSTGADIEMAR